MHDHVKRFSVDGARIDCAMGGLSNWFGAFDAVAGSGSCGLPYPGYGIMVAQKTQLAVGGRSDERFTLEEIGTLFPPPMTVLAAGAFWC